MNDITSERENFTFNNFDELKGFLKGKTILVATASDAVKLNKVLQNLEFVHIPQLVLIADNRNKIVYKVSDTSFTREYYENIDQYVEKIIPKKTVIIDADETIEMIFNRLGWKYQEPINIEDVWYLYLNDILLPTF